MTKFELLVGTAEDRKDKKSDSPKKETESISDPTKAIKLKEEINEITQGRNLEDLGLEELNKVLKKYQEIKEALGITPEKKIEGTIQEQMDMAKEVMGKEFLGPEEVKKAFGIEMNPEDIPEIPFSKEELEIAKELDQFLVLRVDKAKDGEMLSMKKMQELLFSEFEKEKLGKIFWNTDWYKAEKFFTEDAPKLSWALTGKEIIPDSNNKNYLQQTESIIDYLKEKVFKMGTLPKEYQEAIEEFSDKKAEIEKLLKDNWQEAAKMLEELKITKLTRQSPVEFMYDILVYFKNNKERLFESMYAWTGCRASDGNLVLVGVFAAGGAGVSYCSPDGSVDGIGVAFSRRSAMGG